jgi:hypothetical protein
MANLEQTPFGWRTMGADGNPVEIPDEIAREVYPDYFAQPADMGQGEHQLGGMVPVPGTAAAEAYVPPAPPDPAALPPEAGAAPSAGWDEFIENPLGLTGPPPAPELQPGQSRSSSRSVSFRGTRPLPPIKDDNKIDPKTIDQSYQPYRQAFGEIDAEKRGANADLGEAQAGLDEASAQHAWDKQWYLDGEHKRTEERNVKATAARAEHEARIQSEIAAIPQSDPGRWFNSKSGFDQSMAALTMAIGGYLSVSRGGPNQAVDTALKLIDNDMRAQETDIATARAKVGFAESAYARLDDKLAGESLYHKEQKIFKLEALAAGLDTEAAKYKSKYTQAENRMAAVKLREESVLRQFGLLKDYQDTVQKALKHNDDHDKWVANERTERARISASVSTADKDRAERREAREGKDGPKPTTILGPTSHFSVGGRQFVVPGESEGARKENAEKLQSRGQGGNTVYRAAEALKQMINNGSIADPEYRSQVNQYVSEMTLGSAKLSGTSLSNSSDADMALNKNVQTGTDPLGVLINAFGSKDETIRALNRFQDNTRKDQTAFIRSFGDQRKYGGEDYTQGEWTPEPLEELKSSGITSFEDAHEKVRNTPLDPNVREVEGTGKQKPVSRRPGDREAFAPRDDGHAPPEHTVPRQDHTSNNPELDQVNAIVANAKTMASQTKGKSKDALGAGAEDLFREAEKLRDAGYVSQANTVLDYARDIVNGVERDASGNTSKKRSERQLEEAKKRAAERVKVSY